MQGRATNHHARARPHLPHLPCPAHCLTFSVLKNHCTNLLFSWLLNSKKKSMICKWSWEWANDDSTGVTDKNSKRPYCTPLDWLKAFQGYAISPIQLIWLSPRLKIPKEHKQLYWISPSKCLLHMLQVYNHVFNGEKFIEKLNGFYTKLPIVHLGLTVYPRLPLVVIVVAFMNP